MEILFRSFSQKFHFSKFTEQHGLYIRTYISSVQEDILIILQKHTGTVKVKLMTTLSNWPNDDFQLLCYIVRKITVCLHMYIFYENMAYDNFQIKVCYCIYIFTYQ